MSVTATHWTEGSQKPYRLNVGLCLFNDQGLVFCAERSDKAGAWQMPQGGIQEGEDYRISALRELKEEIGTDKAEIIAEAPEVLRYDFPDYVMNSPQGFNGKYRGQEQRWLALRFLGTEADIDLSGKDEPERPEFVAWAWKPLEELPSLIVPFKRPVYEQVVAFFAPLAEEIKKQR